MELNLKKIDWRQPPHELKANIDGNFSQLQFALNKVTEQLNQESARFESLDGNIAVETPKGINLNHKMKLSDKLNIKNINGANAEFKKAEIQSIVSKTIESDILKADDKHFSIDRKLCYDVENEALTLGVDSELTTGPKKKTRLRLAPVKDTSAYHSLVIQSQAGSKKGNFKDETTHLVVKGDGKIGIGTFHKLKASLTIAGAPEAQLCLNKPFTPFGKDKAPAGSIAWDENYIYVKTEGGWKRSKLEIA